MSYDRRWAQQAREWLTDCELPNDGGGLSPAQIERYTPKLAQRLQDVAEEFVSDEIPQAEADAHDAARDAKIERMIDESRGK